MGILCLGVSPKAQQLNSISLSVQIQLTSASLSNNSLPIAVPLPNPRVPIPLQTHLLFHPLVATLASVRERVPFRNTYFGNFSLSSTHPPSPPPSIQFIYSFHSIFLSSLPFFHLTIPFPSRYLY